MNDPRAAATAHQAWDERWSTAAGRAAWLEPQEEVISVISALLAGRGARALDLGCGVGRHALCLAEHGLRVSTIDASGNGIEFARREAARRGRPLSLVVGAMTDRQVAPNTFVQDTDDGDRRHPHFYCDSVEVVELFTGFELRSLVERTERPDSYHWHLVATRGST